jgi:hypothetical protein
LTRGGLQPAHEGYKYQDLLTAHLLVMSLLGDRPNVSVDKKNSSDDRFDDVRVHSAAGDIRRQVKHSTNAQRVLKLQDLSGQASSLRIDRLIGSFLADNPPADEYRICANWATFDPELKSFFHPVLLEPTVEGTEPAILRVDAERLFFDDGQNPLRQLLLDACITHAQVTAFASRFAVELCLPGASGNLARPGNLERALIELLRGRIGIGEYPNDGRSATDVAAVAISLATRARSRNETLSPDDVEIALQIRKDFGYVPQRFPVRWDRFRDRPIVTESIQTLLSNSQIVIAEGFPGIGKSWILTKLCSDLDAGGALVARHYCYLEPGDELVERRVTVDAMLGNLLEELTRKSPALLDKLPKRYSATQESLEAALAAAADMGREVFLVVDGLDHILRVRADSKALSIEDTSIVEQLAGILLPIGSRLVVGSQPGLHLDALRLQAPVVTSTYQVPRWEDAEIRALSETLKVGDSVTRYGVSAVEVVDAFVRRAEGNPLYAYTLAADLGYRLESGEVSDPLNWLNELPAIDGEIARYYEYLFNSLDELSQQFAKVLGCIDFAVTSDDLREIFPAPFGVRAKSAIARLSPVLAISTGQGGCRIYHESFRRFITQWLGHYRESVGDVLAPVVDWLSRRGFYEDALSYRFLLPTLYRAGRNDEILRAVGLEFVSQSLSHGHVKKPLVSNLLLAAYASEKALSWVALVRCLELQRSIYECFESKLSDPILYWETYLSLFGPQALLQRLLFDGKPTSAYAEGLHLCAQLDAAGVIPPWREYWALYSQDATERESSSANEYGPQIGGLTSSETTVVEAALGSIRLKGLKVVAKRVMREMSANRWGPPRRLGLAVLLVIGSNAPKELVTKISTSRWMSRLSPKWRSCIALACAELLTDPKDLSESARLATLAAEYFKDARLLYRCLKAGADLPAIIDKLPIDIEALSMGGASPNRKKVERWYFSVRASAGFAGAAIRKYLSDLNGAGWYICWVRYVLSLALAESAVQVGESRSLLIDSFAELVGDPQPFTGKPRACDMYQVRGVVIESIVWGLSQLQNDDEWRVCLGHVQVAMEGTLTSLQRAISGPIQPELLIAELVRIARSGSASGPILEFAKRAVAHRDDQGTYLESHAELRMLLIQLLVDQGFVEEARAIWSDVCVMLGGYGYRRDRSLFELMEAPIKVVFPFRERAVEALAALQPMAEALWTFTDGKETRGAPNEWFRHLLGFDLSAAATALAYAQHGALGDRGWPVNQAFEDLLEAVVGSCDPRLASFLCETLPVGQDEAGSEKWRMQVERTVVDRLAEIDFPLACEHLVRLSAQVDGDGLHRSGSDDVTIRDLALKVGCLVPLPTNRQESDRDSKNETRSSTAPGFELAAYLSRRFRVPWFDQGTTRSNIISGIRLAFSMRGDWYDSDAGVQNSGFIEAFGYRLVELANLGEPAQSLEGIVLLVSERLRDRFASGTSLLAELGYGLERFGLHRLAAAALVSAYTSSRGHGGWASVGDEAQAGYFLAAVSIDGQVARRVFFGEMVRRLVSADATMLITGSIIARLAEVGDVGHSSLCWWEALAVIRHRLPVIGTNGSWLPPLRQCMDSGWSNDEAAAAVLLSRVDHPLYSVKMPAMVAMDSLFGRLPRLFVGPLRWYLTCNATVTSMMTVLAILDACDQQTNQEMAALQDELSLIAEGGSCGGRVIYRGGS